MDGIAVGRSKRQKVDKHGRLSALEKLKQLKSTGSKRKYEVDNLENVYDVVDESEYTERVLQRQEDDWIEDDDGCGYVEDGREIFDEDGIQTDAQNQSENRAKKRKAKVKPTATESRGNIRNLISNMPNKKRDITKAAEDSILSDLMSEVSGEFSQSKTPSLKSSIPVKKVVERPSSLEYDKREAENYFKSLESRTVLKENKTFTNGNSLHGSKMDFEDLQFVDKKIATIKEECDIKVEQSSVNSSAVDGSTQNIEEVNTEDVCIANIDFDENCEFDKQSMELKQEESVHFDEPFEMEEKPQMKIPAVKSDHFRNLPDMNVIPQNVTTCENVDITLPMLEDGTKVVRFYWWDAWEDRFVKPGVVFLFGKVYIDHSNPSNGSVSCCLCVKNIDKKLFLLPREYKLDPVTQEENSNDCVTFTDVYEEFKHDVAAKLNIKEFRSRKVEKNYAFDLPNVPSRSEYMEIRYPATFPSPPTNEKYTTFSHIFGTTTSSLEIFLLERKIKGPCWLEIKNPEFVNNKVSWCKVEFNCTIPDNVSVIRNENISPPPLTIATIQARTVLDTKTRQNTIIMLSCLISHSFQINKPPPNPPFQQHFCVFTRSSDVIWPADIKQVVSQFKATKLTKCESERELLNYFLVQFWRLDPDLIVGHDLLGYQQDLLIGNILNKNIPNWSRLGRLRRTVAPQKMYVAKDAFLGRLVCDIKVSSMELIRSRSYDLDTLCVNVLKLSEETRTNVTADEIPKYYSTSEDILNLISLTMQDATYILKIMCELNVLPLALQITQIAGNVMSKTLLGGRSERNEFLLLHAFTEKDYIVPDKMIGRKIKEEKNENEDTVLSKKQVQSRKKPTYSGGLVLDPKVGFYDKLILLMDFNSLYPSIIQEYNICFTTIKRNVFLSKEDEMNDLILPDSNTEIGVLPTQIRKLVESRREVKKLMKTVDSSTDLYMQYNIRQLALKLTANSMYGCLGFAHSRFYAKSLAALVTLKGREILTNTKEMVSRLNYDVVYGDTDSIMINTNCPDYDQVFKIGFDIKKEINKKYKHIELDIDGVFKYLLLLKKKKYAAVLISKNKNGDFVTTQELKGLDIVRRDWSQLAAEAGKFILSQILSDQAPDERIENIQLYLTRLKDDIKDNKMPLSTLTITKQLAKNPDEYPDKVSQPHVQVALRLNSKNGRKYRKGDIVPYIICEDGTTKVAIQRSYHIEELKNSSDLKVDVNYYLAHQLHPVISRICDPIDGLDAARIADFLGLDSSSYKQVKKEVNDGDVFQLEQEKTKYKDCSPFTFKCINDQCNFVNVVKDINSHFLERCQNTDCKLRPIDYFPAVVNQLTVQIRHYVAKYYENWLICEDPACTNRLVKLPHNFSAGYPICNACEKAIMCREYTEKNLYYQISYFRYLFDVNTKNYKSQTNQQILTALHCLKECVEDALSHSAYSFIDLTQLFNIYDTKLKPSTEIKQENIHFDTSDIEQEEYDQI